MPGEDCAIVACSKPSWYSLAGDITGVGLVSRFRLGATGPMLGGDQALVGASISGAGGPAGPIGCGGCCVCQGTIIAGPVADGAVPGWEVGKLPVGANAGGACVG